MTLSIESAVGCHDVHDNIDNDTREHVKSMETCNGEKVIGEIGAGCCTVDVGKRVAAPPGALVIEVPPFPCLATQESGAANDGPEHPFHNTLPVVPVTGSHGQYHGYRTHDQDEGHQTHKGQRYAHFTNKRKRSEHEVGIGPAIGRKTDGTVGDQKSAESKSVTHQEIPHHQFAVLHVEGTLTPLPTTFD